MAVKYRHPCLLLEGTIQNAVKVSSLHGDTAVQISITVIRQHDFAQNPRIAVVSVSSPPQSQASLLLPSATSESAQKVVRELTMEGFAQNNPVLQRVLQILRIWLSKYVRMFLPPCVSIWSQKSLGGALIAIQV